MAGSDRNREDVKEIVMTHRNVVVTVNYRLGVFGFLASNRMRAGHNSSTVGNWGTLDQQMSLRWVQDNIARFGGDPSRVSVGGWSAGAAMISVHLAMESSKGLFRNAIMLNGGFTNWAAITMEDAEMLYDQTIKDAGCYNHSECLEPGPVCACLLNADGHMLAANQPGWGWAPTIDGVSLLLHPKEAVKVGKVQKGIPIFLGGAAEDSTVDIGASASDANFIEYLRKTGAPDSAASFYLNDDMKKELYVEGGLMGAAHKGWSPAYWATRTAIADRTMNCPNKRAAKLWKKASGAEAYWYVWSGVDPSTIEKQKGWSPSVSHGPLKIDRCWNCPGAGHPSILPYMFEKSKLNVQDTVSDLADVYQTFFKNFLGTSNPNDFDGFTLTRKGGDGGYRVAWPPVSSGTGGMSFVPGKIEVVKGLKDDVCDMWER